MPSIMFLKSLVGHKASLTFFTSIPFRVSVTNSMKSQVGTRSESLGAIFTFVRFDFQVNVLVIVEQTVVGERSIAVCEFTFERLFVRVVDELVAFHFM